MRSRGLALRLLATAGCSRCGGTSAAAAEELLPAHPPGAVVTAPLGAVAQHLLALTERASSLPGGEQLGEVRRGMTAQLGFDPLTRDGLLSAGLDPDRGAAVALFDGQDWIASLPLTKPDVFLQTVQRLLVERAGFAPVAEQPKATKIFERRGHHLGVAVVRGYGIVARARDPSAAVADASERPKEQALALDPGLAAARKLRGGQDFIAWAPAGSALPRRYTRRELPGDAAVSARGSQPGGASRLAAASGAGAARAGDAARRRSAPGGIAAARRCAASAPRNRSSAAPRIR